MGTITIENTTHWKTEDIRRVIQIARDAAWPDGFTEELHVSVTFTEKGNPFGRISPSLASYRFHIKLPRRGRKDRGLKNPLLALADAAVDKGRPTLPLTDSFLIANRVAYWLSPNRGGALSGYKFDLQFRGTPTWYQGDIADLYIAKERKDA